VASRPRLQATACPALRLAFSVVRRYRGRERILSSASASPSRRSCLKGSVYATRGSERSRNDLVRGSRSTRRASFLSPAAAVARRRDRRRGLRRARPLGRACLDEQRCRSRAGGPAGLDHRPVHPRRLDRMVAPAGKPPGAADDRGRRRQRPLGSSADARGRALHDRSRLRHPARRALPARLSRLPRGPAEVPIRARARRRRVHGRDRPPAGEAVARRLWPEKPAGGFRAARPRVGGAARPASLAECDLRRRDRRPRGSAAACRPAGVRWRS